jgi:hypothetical protein
MGVTTRGQSRRVPQIPSEVWGMVVECSGYEVYKIVRKLSKHLHREIRFSMPKPQVTNFVLTKTTSGRRRNVHCNMEWIGKGYWKFQCLPASPESPYVCRLPPIFWDKRKTRIYNLSREDSSMGCNTLVDELQPSTVVVHPTRTNKDIQISVDFNRWSHSLSELNDVIQYLAG